MVRYVRRLKYFAVAGTLLFVLAFGLLYRYRGGVETHELAGLVGAEVILGVAGTSPLAEDTLYPFQYLVGRG